jgi:hypothetical protein
MLDEDIWFGIFNLDGMAKSPEEERVKFSNEYVRVLSEAIL